MRLALLALVFILIAGCTAPAQTGSTPTPTATPAATPTPLATPAPSIGGQATPTPTATPTPAPAKTTYIALTDRVCSPTNIMLELENSGMYNSGKPLMRVYQMENGEKTKTCLEFTLPFEVLKGQSKTQYNFQNSQYGVDECDYSSGNFRLEVVEPGTSGVWFKAIDFSCPED